MVAIVSLCCNICSVSSSSVTLISGLSEEMSGSTGSAADASFVSTPLVPSSGTGGIRDSVSCAVSPRKIINVYSHNVPLRVRDLSTILNDL